MVLALISTACISNVVYSLQALLIYARISNAMEAASAGPFESKWGFDLMKGAAQVQHILLKKKKIISTGLGGKNRIRLAGLGRRFYFYIYQAT